MITEVTGDQHRTRRHDDTCSTTHPSAFSIRLMAGCQIFLNKSPSVWRGESNSLSMSFSLIPSATCQMSRASEIPRIAAAIIWLAVSKERWPELYLTPDTSNGAVKSSYFISLFVLFRGSATGRVMRRRRRSSLLLPHFLKLMIQNRMGRVCLVVLRPEIEYAFQLFGYQLHNLIHYLDVFMNSS